MISVDSILLIAGIIPVIIIAYFWHITKIRLAKSQYQKKLELQVQTISQLKEELNICYKKGREYKNEKKSIEDIWNSINECIRCSYSNENSFEKSMRHLAGTLRKSMKCEYCSIGKIYVNESNAIAEDYAVHLDKIENKKLYREQLNAIKQVRSISLNEKEYFLTLAYNLENKVTYFEGKNLELSNNKHLDLYKNKILKSGEINNIAIIKLEDAKGNICGYIQIINYKNKDCLIIDNCILDSLCSLIQVAINFQRQKQLLEEKDYIIRDFKFIQELLNKNETTDALLEKIMAYLSQEFNAGIISFRIPFLNGTKKTPLFYMRKCYVSPLIHNANKIQEYYELNRKIKSFEEMGGKEKMNCKDMSEISFVDSQDNDYYEKFDLNLAIDNNCIIMPIIKNRYRERCIKDSTECICSNACINPCNSRFGKMYGIFKLRLLNENKNKQTLERITCLSQQITLIFNALADSLDNQLMIHFTSLLQKVDLSKLGQFDEQIVTLMRDTLEVKDCFIYRCKKEFNNEKILYLSASTNSSIWDNRESMAIPTLVNDVFQSKTSAYYYDTKETREEILNYPVEDTILFFPILNKEKQSVGVFVFMGKKLGSNGISPAFWEQDISFARFAINIVSRLSEGDEEKKTFLHQLSHELLTPITEIVTECDNFLIRYNSADNESKSHMVKEMLEQIKKNIDSAFLFKNIIMDVEMIYTTSIKDIQCSITEIEDPKDILLTCVRIFEKEASFEKQIKIIPSITDMPTMFFDRYRMQQVFINLLKNAIRYSDVRGEVNIYYKTCNEDIDGLGIQAWHEIKFVNYGIGILEEDKERIFKLYERGKNAKEKRPSGTGMGLFIINNIMKNHKGHCIIRRLSNPTEISILLPNNKK